jgi:hypothetical protein
MAKFAKEAGYSITYKEDLGGPRAIEVNQLEPFSVFP